MNSLEHFCSTVENLKDIYNYHEPYSNVIRIGLVGLYRICFEQSWKAMKELLERDGFAEGQTGPPARSSRLPIRPG